MRCELASFIANYKTENNANNSEINKKKLLLLDSHWL
jgi:hypothetical protein